MRGTSLFWAGVVLLFGIAAWLLGLGDFVRTSIAAGHILDWVMGAFCLVWLLVILKIPWDLYFQAAEVAFEQQRSRERNIKLQPGREAYIRALRVRLGWLAVCAHLFSALLVAGISRYTGGMVGYYFAGFYLVSTLFRPAVAGYVYLAGRLRALREEAHYPREDVVDVLEKLKWQEMTLRDLVDQMRDARERIELDRAARDEAWTRMEAQRDTENRELRQSIHAISREFETTVSRLTDNQDIIDGIQAFLRLVAKTNPAG